jgi:hypothetical protein
LTSEIVHSALPHDHISCAEPRQAVTKQQATYHRSLFLKGHRTVSGSPGTFVIHYECKDTNPIQDVYLAAVPFHNSTSKLCSDRTDYLVRRPENPHGHSGRIWWSERVGVGSAFSAAQHLIQIESCGHFILLVFVNVGNVHPALARVCAMQSCYVEIGSVA